MNHLHRQAAPISDTAWARIDEEARDALHEFLAARRLVDVQGPLGWDKAALPDGDLEPIDIDIPAGPQPPARTGAAGRVGLRSVLRLIEVRAPFSVGREIIRTIDRGAPSVDLSPVIDAARQAAAIEDETVFSGLKEAGIMGCSAGSVHEPLSFSGLDTLADAVAEGTAVLGDAGVEGPYGLALADDLWRSVVATVEHGYPLVKHLRLIAGGPVVRAPTISGAMLLSQRGGDFELVIGGDFAIGYEATNADTVELYLAETFTFRNLEPAAAVALHR